MSAMQGITVLELAETVAGEYCGKLLADFGADVVKLERPGVGSPTRRMGPFGRSGRDGENSGLFAYLNTSKRSVELDLTDTAALMTLVDRADVVIDDHASGFLASVGLDPETLARTHPHLVLCSVTAFGQHPPEDRRHAEDLTVFQASGWGFHTPTGAEESQPPLKGAGRFLVSYESGLDAALCIAAALCDREQSGSGRFIDICAQQVMASRVDYVLGQMIAGDMDVSTDRKAFDLSGPAGIFRCRDGYAYLWMSAPAHWDGLRKLLDDPAWMDEFPDRWLELDCTPERVAQCRAHIAEWLANEDKHAISARAQELGLTMAAVQNAEDIARSAQYRHRGFFTEVDHPELGVAAYPTVPYKLSETPARIHAPAPLLGQHSRECLAADAVTRQPARPSAAPAPASRGGPLAGVRVVELTKVWAGPFVGKLLAFLGAEVIRVESMSSLDVTRVYGVKDMNKAPGFMAVNPQKLSVQINMKTAEGIGLIRDLLAESDMVIQNLRPGAVERLGLDYAAAKAANPDIVYVSMGMYGSDGPLARETGYAPLFAALGGVSLLVGNEDEPPGGMNVRYADSTFGCAAAFAGVAALLHKRRGGSGQFIDVSAVESMTSMIGDTVMDYALNGVVHECDGNRHAEMAPHGTFRCADGDWLGIAASSDAVWQALAGAMGQPELASDARFASLAARKANEAELDAIVGDWAAGQEAADAAARLQAAGVAAAKSQSSMDMIADAHLWARGFYPDVTDATGASRPIVGPSWTMSRPAAILDGAPHLGQHNDYVFGEVMGLSTDEQTRLAADGIIH